MNKTIKPVAFAVLATLALTGCSDKAREPFQDAPRGTTNDHPADIINFPDGYSNVASKCDGPNRVYVIYKADDPTRGSIAVVPNDPRCGG